MPDPVPPDAGTEPLTWGILSTARIADEVIPGLKRLAGGVTAVASRSQTEQSTTHSRTQGAGT